MNGYTSNFVHQFKILFLSTLLCSLSLLSIVHNAGDPIAVLNAVPGEGAGTAVTSPENDHRTRAPPKRIFWNSTNSPVIHENKSFSNTELVIEPGTTIRFDEGKSIQLSGRLLSKGTEDSPVKFVSNGSGVLWAGIVIKEPHLGTSYLNHTFFTNANTSLSIQGGNAELYGCRFGSDNEAIYVNHSIIAVTNTTFNDCDRYLRVDQNSEIETLNTSVPREKITIEDEESKVVLKWYLTLLFDGNEKSTPVNVFNLNHENIYKGKTDSEGRLSNIPCREVMYKKRSSTYYTAHRINYPTRRGMNNRYVYLNRSKTIVLPAVYFAKRESLISRVDVTSLKAYTRDILNFPNRWTFSPEHEKVTNYLYTRLLNLPGLDVVRDNFTVEAGNDSHKVINVVATQKGRDVSPDKPEYLIAAHYDTEAPGFKGGDDDASGVAALLESARILSSYEFNATIKYVVFDGDANGSGNLGSEKYASNATLDNISGVFSLDRIGHDEGGNGKCGIWTDPGSSPLVNSMITLNENLEIDLDIIPNTGFAPGQDSYRKFRDYGFKAVGLSESNEEDVDEWWPERPPKGADHMDLDYEYIKKFAQLTTATVFSFAEVKQYDPTPPLITSPNRTHMRSPLIEWKESFDYNGYGVAYRISVRDRNGTPVVSENWTTETEYQIPGNLEYGHVYRINLSAFNAKGGSSGVTTFELSIVNNPPKFSKTENVTAYQDLPLMFTLNATDPDRPADKLFFRIDDDVTGNMRLNESSGEFRWTPNNTNVGTHLVDFSVRDGNGGKDMLTLNITVLNVNDPPVIIHRIEKIEVDEDTSEKLYFNLSDIFYDADMLIDPEERLNYTFLGNSSVKIRVVDNEEVRIRLKKDFSGQENLTIIATDRRNSSSSLQFPFVVRPVNDPPVIKYPTELNFSEGEVITLEPEVFDVDDTNISVNYSGAMDGPVWVTNYSSSGVYNVTIVASDGKNSTQHILMIRVWDVKMSPIPQIRFPDIIAPGKWVTFNAGDSRDLDGAITSYLWDFGDGERAEGKTVEHKYRESGRYNVTLTITDNDGQTNQTSVMVDVEYPSNTQTIVCAISIILAIVGVIAALLSRVGRRELRKITEPVKRRRALPKDKKSEGSPDAEKGDEDEEEKTTEK